MSNLPFSVIVAWPRPCLREGDGNIAGRPQEVADCARPRFARGRHHEFLLSICPNSQARLPLQGGRRLESEEGGRGAQVPILMRNIEEGGKGKVRTSMVGFALGVMGSEKGDHEEQDEEE